MHGVVHDVHGVVHGMHEVVHTAHLVVHGKMLNCMIPNGNVSEPVMNPSGTRQEYVKNIIMNTS